MLWEAYLLYGQEEGGIGVPAGGALGTLLGVEHSVHNLTALAIFGGYSLALHRQQPADVLKH